MTRFRAHMTALLLPLIIGLAGGEAAGKPIGDRGDSSRARLLFRKAEVRYGMGEFSRALALYQQAYRALPMPGFHFNMAQCYRHLGQHRRAILHFQQYLALRPHAPNRVTVEKLIRLSQEALQEGTPPTSSPVERPSPPPKSAPLPPASAATPAPAMSKAWAPRLVPTLPESGRSDRRVRPVYFWSGVGLTAALLVSGTVTGAMTLAQNSEYKDPRTSNDRRQALKDTGQRLAVASSVSFGLAGAVGLGTAILYWFTDFRPRRAELSAVAGRDGGLLTIRGGF